MGAFELHALLPSSAAIALKASTSRLSSSAERTAIARRSRRGRCAGSRASAAAPDRDALGEREADRRAEQDEAQRRKVDAAIEIGDLPLDFALP